MPDFSFSETDIDAACLIHEKKPRQEQRVGFTADEINSVRGSGLGSRSVCKSTVFSCRLREAQHFIVFQIFDE